MTIQFRLHSIFFVLLISLSQSILAGSSTIENGNLYIPRIDIEGYGPSQITFRIDFQNQYVFTLIDFSEAGDSIENSGVFDTESNTLHLDQIALETGESYSAQISLLSLSGPITFKLDDALLISPTEQGESSEEAIALYNQQCGDCHGSAGEGVSAPSLIECTRCADNDSLAVYIQETMPLGLTGDCDADCSAILATYILEVLNQDNEAVANRTIGDIQLLGPVENIRKAASQLVSRPPSPVEYELVNDGDFGIRQAIDLMMEEDTFYLRLGEIFNDYLLTNKYQSSNGAERATQLLDAQYFPDKRWFDTDPDNRTADYEIVRRQTNDAIARAPLELINYIVKKQRPFTELLTAQYMMVNPYSAISYGVENEVDFRNRNDLDEFVPASIPDYPHAGILTSPMFLSRYPTTETNRNRGRAKVIFDLFLDTNILAIEGARPGAAVDITTPVPTVNNPQCSKCHSILDPVASTFQNWDFRGRYRPTQLWGGWHEEMSPRGFNGEHMPLMGYVDNSVQWLASEIAVDPRFPKAIMRIIVNGFTGKEPLRAPAAGASQLEIDAYIAERALLNDIQDQFVADNYNLKTMIREFLMSPYWRAKGLTEDANLVAHENTGSSALMIPEQLDRKINSLLGFEWRKNMDSYSTDIELSYTSQLIIQYHQVYGGIDSDTVSTRLKEPNGLMGAMQMRMANELACYAVPEDFLRPQESRQLFPFVDRDLSPFNDSGSINERNMDLIRENIQYLHNYLLGEDFSLGSPELETTEDLFMTIVNIGKQQIEDSSSDWRDLILPKHCDRFVDLQGIELKESEAIRIDRHYITRSWMAVLAYLFADFKFLYE